MPTAPGTWISWRSTTSRCATRSHRWCERRGRPGLRAAPAGVRSAGRSGGRESTARSSGWPGCTRAARSRPSVRSPSIRTCRGVASVARCWRAASSWPGPVSRSFAWSRRATTRPRSGSTCVRGSGSSRRSSSSSSAPGVRAGAVTPSSARLRDAVAADRALLVERDSRAFGASRPQNVDLYLRRGRALVAERGTAPAGYAFGIGLGRVGVPRVRLGGGRRGPAGAARVPGDGTAGRRDGRARAGAGWGSAAGGRSARHRLPGPARVPLHGARRRHGAAAELRPDERRPDVTRAQSSGVTSTATPTRCSPPPSTTPRSGLTSA